jgi:pilus assembly protein CpaB
MRANTIIMIGLAAVFGIVAVVLANMWLAGQRSAMAATSPDAPSDTVVVAAVSLKFGDVLSGENLREIAWPAGALPTGSFRTTKELLEAEGGNRQALQAIGANEPVLATKITGAGQRATLSAVLAEGMRAVSIRVNDVLGVAGFVFPGDRVDVLLSRKVRDTDGNEQSYVDVLLQSVKVLAVDQVADESSENPTVVKAVTVEVDTKDAQKLTLAADAGQLSLALRQAASSEGGATERVTLADLVGESPEDIARRKAEAERLAALEADRKRAADELSGIRSDLQSLGAEFDGKLKALQQPKAEPEIKEVVKEVVKYVEPERPAMASVGVFRGMERQVYDVPRSR